MYPTSANSFGIWSATVPATGTLKAQRERARRAIAAQIRLRESGRPVRISLDSATPPVVDGTRTFSERP